MEHRKLELTYLQQGFLVSEYWQAAGSQSGFLPGTFNRGSGIMGVWQRKPTINPEPRGSSS